MHWATLAADAELGITDGLSCSICGHPEVGLLYFPQDMSARQATWISRLWCDPEQVRICEACVDGHGGVTGIRGLDADNWLERRIAVFQARENGKRCESEDSAEPGQFATFDIPIANAPGISNVADPPVRKQGASR